MNKKVQDWIDGAEDALETARVLFDSGRYLFTIFFCHLAIEKILKAAVSAKTGQAAPKTHSLIYLLNLADLSPPDHIAHFLRQIDMLSVPTRYPEAQVDIKFTFNRGRTLEFLEKTREAVRWTKESIAS